jgi:hypothetical protein
MNTTLRVPLNGTAEQLSSLLALQHAFAQVCNSLAPLVQQTRCWNRVTLHHLAYKPLREKFPAMGSQMVCNAIYSVSRTSRLVYQHPASPFNINRLGDKPLPLLQFQDTCPVYFRPAHPERQGRPPVHVHAGRAHPLPPGAAVPKTEASFHEKKLREIVLSRTPQQPVRTVVLVLAAASPDDTDSRLTADKSGEIPEYIMVEETA